MTSIDAPPALTYDEILAQGGRTEDTVPLCLNGRLTRRYEAVAARIAERKAEREAAAEARRLAADAAARIAKLREPNPDDRLTTAPPAPPEVDEDQADAGEYVDPEQPEADRLIAEMKRFTVPYVIRAVPTEQWNKLLEDHPPRKDPADAKKIDPRDFEGINSATFYSALVRASIAEPEHDDARYARLMELLTDAQFDRLVKVASDVNRRDEDLPFSLDDLESPPR